ncbi:response regulator transcription factor [Sulfurospirillum sp. 1307]|jgi:DNA-binding response OmpR family regulator
MYNDLSILCVEDEDGVRIRLVNTLKYYFKEVFEATNGKEGLEIYYEKEPDIIICDIQMPVMSGIEMVKEIRENDLITPIIFLTAYNSEEYLMELINLNIQHFILKPVTTNSLEDGLKSALKGRYSGLVKLKKEVFLDLDNSILKINTDEVALSLRESKFLKLLSRGGVVRYDEIEDELWAEKGMSSSALKSFIRDLRKKIPVELIENIPQVGYKLL